MLVLPFHLAWHAQTQAVRALSLAATHPAMTALFVTWELHDRLTDVEGGAWKYCSETTAAMLAGAGPSSYMHACALLPCSAVTMGTDGRGAYRYIDTGNAQLVVHTLANPGGELGAPIRPAYAWAVAPSSAQTGSPAPAAAL